jgi:hypothetical protein
VEHEEERERREEVVIEGREETVEEEAVDLILPQVFAIHPHLES